jgi:hypothetical protein
MQSGKAGQKRWVLDFEPMAALRPDLLMGWASSADPGGQVRLYFEDRDAAIAFARAHAIPHQVIEPKAARRSVKSYGENFAFARKEPWSH